MTSSEIIIHLRKLIGDQRVGMFATVAPGGEIHSRPLMLAEIDDQGTLWFLVDRRSQWVAGLGVSAAANVSFTDTSTQTWTSVAGTATTNEDQAKIDRLWSTVADSFLPEGKQSGNVRLLSLDGSSAEYWDAPSSTVKRVALMAKAKILPGHTDIGESGTLDLK